jgi:hypothetical protein
VVDTWLAVSLLDTVPQRLIRLSADWTCMSSKSELSCAGMISLHQGGIVLHVLRTAHAIGWRFSVLRRAWMIFVDHLSN